MSSEIQIYDDKNEVLAVVPRRSTLGAISVAVGDADHENYRYAYLMESGVPSKPVYRLQKRLRSDVLLTNTADLVPGAKSRRIGWCSYKDWMLHTTSRESESTVTLEACVAPKVDKI